MKRMPEYNYLLAKDLPPYQLFKRWQRATATKSDKLFGYISRARMLSDIERCKPELLRANNNRR